MDYSTSSFNISICPSIQQISIEQPHMCHKCKGIWCRLTIKNIFNTHVTAMLVSEQKIVDNEVI